MNSATPTFQQLSEVVGDIRQLIESNLRIVCIAHKDADADSLGSALAFTLALRAQGREINCTVPAPMPIMLTHLPGFESVSLTPPEADVVFAFDSAGLGRFGEKREYVTSAARVVNIDHHLSNEGFGSINLVDPSASATGMVVYQLLMALQIPIPESSATNLYAALLTDTGGFRHENTSEAALRLGADLVALGANPGWVALKSYKSRSLRQVRLEALAVAALHSELEGRLLWSCATSEMFTMSGADIQEAEGIIDHLEGIASMQVAIVLKHVNAARTRVSVRTRDQYNATAICEPLGGGGHLRAAGAELELPIDVAAERVMAIARSLMQGNTA